MMLAGLQVIEDRSLVDSVEDWSRVRSPGRARRRQRYGYRQNIRIVKVPKKEMFILGGNKLVVHPDFLPEVIRQYNGAVRARAIKVPPYDR